MSKLPPGTFLRRAAEATTSPSRETASAARSAPSRSEMLFLPLRDLLYRLNMSRSLHIELVRDPVQPISGACSNRPTQCLGGR